MNALKELIDRVEQGTGYDNELNKAVALALGWSIETGLPQGLRWRKPDGSLTAGNPESEDAVNATGSLDAVIALIEAKRPGQSRDMLHEALDEMGMRAWRGWRGENPMLPQMARAALIVLLRALKETSHA